MPLLKDTFSIFDIKSCFRIVYHEIQEWQVKSDILTNASVWEFSVVSIAAPPPSMAVMVPSCKSSLEGIKHSFSITWNSLSIQMCLLKRWHKSRWKIWSPTAVWQFIFKWPTFSQTHPAAKFTVLRQKTTEDIALFGRCTVAALLPLISHVLALVCLFVRCRECYIVCMYGYV